jgi:hypothetical protein
MNDAFSRQVAGNHYTGFAIQPAHFIIENDLGFAQGNIIKYICRYNRPGRTQCMDDLRKAQHYIQMLIEQEIAVQKLWRENRHLRESARDVDVDITLEVDDPRIAAQIKQATGCEDGACDI